MIAACDAPDGSHWALQQWARLWKNYGGDRAPERALHLALARQFSARNPSSPICSAKPCAVLPVSATSFHKRLCAEVAERGVSHGASA